MAENDDHMIEITSTDLTKALEFKAFEEAERIIKENRDPNYLNKGAYGALPLIMVLSGKAGYRNLYLAQLLVKEGAVVNPYLPWQMGGTTPLEYVVNLYLDMKAISEGRASLEGDSSLTTIIGLHREQNPPPCVLKAHCWELIELFVAYGAHPGVITFHGELPIFHRVVADKEPDIDLVMKLYEAGGDFNRQNFNGNTPLMDHVLKADRDSALPLFDQVMSLVPELRLDFRNKAGATILWCAMLAGSPRIAVNLIRRGASAAYRAVIDTEHGECTAISPIFAPLVRNSVLYMDLHGVSPSFSVTHLNKVMSRSVFPVVECTDVCGRVLSELRSLLSSRTKFPMKMLEKQGVHREDVTVLMLGSVKCGLQQLCVRKIVEQLVNIWGCEAWDKDVGDKGRWITKLTPPIVETVVKDRLNLPVSFVPRFLIEAARLQLGVFLFSAKFLYPDYNRDETDFIDY